MPFCYRWLSCCKCATMCSYLQMLGHIYWCSVLCSDLLLWCPVTEESSSTSEPGEWEVLSVWSSSRSAAGETCKFWSLWYVALTLSELTISLVLWVKQPALLDPALMVSTPNCFRRSWKSSPVCPFNGQLRTGLFMQPVQSTLVGVEVGASSRSLVSLIFADVFFQYQTVQTPFKH